MKNECIVENKDFNAIDFSESFMSIYEVRDDSLILMVWGCAFHEVNIPEFRNMVPKATENASVYIAGYSEIRFTEFVSYSIETLLYEEFVLGSSFRKDKEGHQVVVLETKTGNTMINGAIHSFDCVNTQIFGYSTVEITNVGPIHFIFNDDDLISLDNFVRNPRKYVPPPLRME